MGQSTPLTPVPTTTAPSYLVGRGEGGQWIVRDTCGLAGGLFVDKTAAIRFASFEADHRPNAIVLVPENIRLNLAGAVPRL